MIVNGAIFDFDGTLFDSMSIWDSLGEQYLTSLGKIPAPGLQQILNRMSLHQAACYLQEEYCLPFSIEEIINGMNQMVDHFYFDSILPKPGIVSFLKQLKKHDVKMCIASATEEYQIRAALKRCGMEDFFSDILTCSSVGAGKDNPLIFQQALKSLQTEKSDTLVFEDAYHAAATAKTDGFIVAAVFDRYEPEQEKLLSNADFFLPDYSDFDSFWNRISVK